MWAEGIGTVGRPLPVESNWTGFSGCLKLYWWKTISRLNGSSSTPVSICPASRSVVRISQPFFSVFDEFNETSYARRYELLGERLVLERLYTRSCLILSERSSGARGGYSEPNPALTFAGFIKSLIAHCRGAIHD